MKTLKESFIKAEGSGLSYGLQNLEFVVSSNWPPSVHVTVSVDPDLQPTLLGDYIRVAVKVLSYSLGTN